MRVPLRGASLAMLAVVIAGCADGDGPGKDRLRLADGSTIALGEGTSATLGAIAGVVVDEAVRPIEGAVVGTMASGSGRNVTTAADGVFLLGGLEPGFYALEVTAAGHLPVQASADVVAGETATVKVQLPRDVRPVPYHETYPFEAFMAEWASIAQFFVEDAADEALNESRLCDCSYSFTPAGTMQGLVFEAFWDPTTPDPAGLAEYYWEVGGGGDSDWDEVGYCFSPCRVDVDLDDYTPGETVHVRFTGPDLWVAYQQQVRLYTTAFHNAPAPGGWTIAGA